MRAKFVQSRSIVVRLGEAGFSRECLRRGSVEERSVSYWCWPSWSQSTLTLVLGTLGATRARGGRDVGYTGAGEGRHHHVMV